MKIDKKNMRVIVITLLLMPVIYSCAKNNENHTLPPPPTNDSTKDFPANPLVKAGYTLDFDDEFNGAGLDQTKWLNKYFPHGTPSNSQGVNATYTLNNGKLNLSIAQGTNSYYPGDANNFRVSSIQTFEKNYLHPGAGKNNVTDVPTFNGYGTTYGYFEMRAKLPNCGGGGHSAWWMVACQDDADVSGQNFKESAEIDIIEPLFSQSNNSYPKVHPFYDTTITEWGQQINNPGDPSNEYHIYAMDWTPAGINFYYDNKLIAATTNSPKYRMCMLLSLYASYDNNYWSGRDNGIFPKTLSVDYIRVWKKTN